MDTGTRLTSLSWANELHYTPIQAGEHISQIADFLEHYPRNQSQWDTPDVCVILINSNCSPSELLGTDFLECIFLALGNVEKVGNERLAAGKLMHWRTQIIS